MGDADIRVGTARGWRFASILSILTLIGGVLVMIPLFTFRYEIAEFLTQDEQIKELVANPLPIVFISYLLETIQLQRQGVIRGLNLQGKAWMITLFCYWLVGVPQGLLMAFRWGKSIEGLRVGLLIA